METLQRHCNPILGPAKVDSCHPFTLNLYDFLITHNPNTREEKKLKRREKGQTENG